MDVDLSNHELFVPSVPHDVFDWLRENAAVSWNPLEGDDGFWNLVRHADVVYASRHHEIFSSARGVNIEDAHGGWELAMVNMDPPKHTRIRSLVSKGFHPKTINAMVPHIREIAKRIVDGVAAKGECDFVTEVSAELPLAVIAEMIGVPREDHHKIFDWSNRLIAGGAGSDPEYGGSIEDAHRRRDRDVGLLGRDRRQASRRAEGRPHHDPRRGRDRRRPARRHGVQHLPAAARRRRQRNHAEPDLRRHAAADGEPRAARAAPRESGALLQSAINEMLRMVSPVMHFRRSIMRDASIGGQEMRDGDKILMWYVAANRDPEAFPDPHRFDIEPQPRRARDVRRRREPLLSGLLARRDRDQDHVRGASRAAARHGARRARFSVSHRTS